MHGIVSSQVEIGEKGGQLIIYKKLMYETNRFLHDIYLAFPVYLISPCLVLFYVSFHILIISLYELKARGRTRIINNFTGRS